MMVEAARPSGLPRSAQSRTGCPDGRTPLPLLPTIPPYRHSPFPTGGYLMAALTPLQSLVATGTKLWLDSVDPKEVISNRERGATGATSNPIIVADLVKTGRFDDLLTQYTRDGLDDEALAWKVTDHLVSEAQNIFKDVWTRTNGDDGYVSFELDPLLEDTSCKLSVSQRSARYVELGKH